MTIMFADVTGSTAMGEEMDPEDVRALLGRYYGIAKEVVSAHGGTVEKFIGDAVMAVFGLEQAHGDDARRALDAALQMRERVQTDPRLGERIPIRIGINTGEVVATRERGTGDFLITGDAVNVAARIQQLADPWQIVCGERTVHAAGAAFEFAEPVQLEAKGKRRPVAASALVGRSTARALPRLPLLGRDDDLTQLELTASRAFKERRPFLVSLIAPAGTGKTRLLEEFLDRLPARSPDARVAIAQCLPYGQRLTYWPLRGILYRLAGIAEDAQPAAVRQRILAWLRALGAEEVDELAHQLAATVGAAEEEAPDPAALFAAWRGAIELATRREPHVIVFEDLHWSSDSLLDLVEFVMQPRGDAPILMLVLTRPELLDRRPNWGGGRRNHLALALEPLSDEAVRGIVSHLIESPRPDVVDRVVARAEGNPFYAGELVRALVDRLGHDASAQAIDQALASLPDTVQATVLARLDLLSPDERRALQVGAVLGRSFRPAGLTALDPQLARPETTCDALAERDLIRPSGGDSYVFRHILIREVAYQMLPRAERARLHALAGDWLERGAAGREDAYAELVAYHFREAAALGAALDDPARLSEISRSAVRWLRRAGEVAEASAAHIEAARHFRAALELAEPSEKAGLYIHLGNTATRGDDVVEAYLTAYELRREQGASPDEQFDPLGRLLHVLMRSPGFVGAPPPPEAIEDYRATAARLAEVVTDRERLAWYHAAEAFYPFWSDSRRTPTAEELAAAERSALQAFELGRELGDARLQSAALDGLDSIQIMRGDWRLGLETARRRLGIRGRLDLTERIDAYSMATWASSLLGELDQALAVSAEGLAAVQPGQAPAWMLHLVAWRAYAQFLRGEWDQTVASGDRMLELWNETGRGATGYAQRGFVAAFEVAKSRQDDPRAERLADAIRTIHVSRASVRGFDIGLFIQADTSALVSHVGEVQRSGRELGQDWLERAMSRAADEAFPVSEPFVKRQLAIAERLGLRPWLGQVLRAGGVAERRSDRLERALDIFTAIGSLPFAARASCEIALLTGDDAAFEQGAKDLERLGDKRQLARYEERRRSR